MNRAARTRAVLVLVLSLGLSMTIAGGAHADALDDAKAAGWLGERVDGYLGVVNSAAPGDVKALAADINAKSDWEHGGFGILEEARPEEADGLIARGAEIDVCAAAHLGRLDVLKALIAADPLLVNAKGGDGKRPLHCATTVEIAEYLGVPQRRALLLIERISLTNGDKRVYFQRRYYRSDRVAYELELARDSSRTPSDGMPLREFEPVFKAPGKVSGNSTFSQ